MRAALARAAATLPALGLGIAGGFIADRAGMPLPWMLGPMILNTAVALAGVNLVAPVKLRLVFIPVIGVMLGSSIHPDVIHAALAWWPGVIALPPFLAVAGYAAWLVLRHLGRFDPVSAYYAALPGGVNEAIILGEDAGGEVRRIALAHATRILIVVFCIAMFFYLVFGVRGTGSAASWVGLSEPGPFEYAVLTLAGVIGTLAATRLGLPAAQVMGPMVLSGLAHGTGLIEIPPPTILVLIAQMVIGANIGCRFSGARLADIGRDLGVAALAALVMLVVTIAFSALLVWLAGVNFSVAVLAYSPGGLAEMSLIALSMGQDIAYVSVMHIVRIVMVVTCATALFGWLIGPRAGKGGE